MRQLVFVCIQALLLILVAHFALKFYFEEDVPMLPPPIVPVKVENREITEKQPLPIDEPTENFRAFEEFQSEKYIDRSTPVINVMNLNLQKQRKQKSNLNKVNVSNDVLHKIDLHSMKDDLKQYLSTFSLKDFYNTTEDLDQYKVKSELTSKAVIGQPSKQEYLESSVGVVAQTPEKDAYKNYEYLMYESDAKNGKTGICGVNGNDSGKLFSVYDDSPILGVGK